MKNLYLVLFVFILPLFGNAQTFNENCDGTRYLTEVFSGEPTMTTVKFGENVTIAGNDIELFMDIFEPEGDVAYNRPVLMFAFGGSFIAGERAATHDLARTFAKKGFVTASIDYRLYDKPLFPFPDSNAMIDVVMQAVSDYKAAIRYLRKDAATTNTFRIDPDFVFTGGISAGSIASIHAAYMDEGEAPPYVQTFIDANGGLEGNTDLPDDSSMGYSTEIQGVINHFGGLHRKEWVDAGDPPIMSIHGDIDQIVPYGFGYARVAIIDILTINGSGALHPAMEAQGIKNELITVPGGGHGGFFPIFNDSMEVRSARFLAEILCGEDVSSEENLTFNAETNAFPNPSSDLMKVMFNAPVSNFDLKIFNQLGQAVYTENNMSGNEFLLNRADIGSGIFVMNINFEDKNIQPVFRKIVFE